MSDNTSNYTQEEELATITKSFIGEDDVTILSNTQEGYKITDIVAIIEGNEVSRINAVDEDSVQYIEPEGVLNEGSYKKILYTRNTQDRSDYASVDMYSAYEDKECFYKVYAQKLEYQLSYDKNSDDAVGSMIPSITEYEDAFSVAVCSFTREGYVFDGWNTQADGSGDDYSENDSIPDIKADMVLYAKWRENITPMCTVTFRSLGNGDFGDGTMESVVQVAPNTPFSDITVPTPNPDTHYYFFRWEYEGNSLRKAKFPETVTSNINLCARFELKYLVFENMFTDTETTLKLIWNSNTTIPQYSRTIRWSRDLTQWYESHVPHEYGFEGWILNNTNGNTLYLDIVGDENGEFSISGLQNFFKFSCNNLVFVRGSLPRALTPYRYQYLFAALSHLMDVGSLILPVENLSEGCYQGMFRLDNSIQTSPLICATNPDIHCFEAMFDGCSSLTTVYIPEISTPLYYPSETGTNRFPFTLGWMTDVPCTSDFEFHAESLNSNDIDRGENGFVGEYGYFADGNILSLCPA